jgi:hypothetical protein
MRTRLDPRLGDPSGDERRARRWAWGPAQFLAALPRQRAALRDELLAAWHPQGARGGAEG